MHAAISIGLALVLSAHPLVAQTVSGTVRSSDDGVPVHGVLVVLLAGDGARQAGAITDPDGTYRIRSRPGEDYRLVAERIGFASTRSEPFGLSAGQALRIDLLVSVKATKLEGVVAAGGSRGCTVRPEVGVATQRLWDEARKALTATEVTREMGLVRWRAYDHVREIDPETRLVRSERSAVRNGSGDRPYVSVPAELLASDGFVVTRGDTSTYYAPDAGVLLSDPFLDTHCFHPVASADGHVGLAFQPIAGRRVTDIRGVLWMDQSTSELRRLEFSYTALPIYVAGQKFGGEVEFERLATGAWITRRWELRLPKIERWRDPTLRCRRDGLECWTHREETLVRLGRIHEEGGEVMEISTSEHGVIARSRRAALEGSVTDSTTGRPLPDAEVYLSGTSHSAMTDAHGRFAMRELPAGEYTLGFMHPKLDSLGVLARPRRVTLARGETTAVRLVIPSLGALAAESCSGTAVAGVVTDSLTGTPLPGARVILTSGGDLLETTATAGGAYHLCGVPAGPLRLRATVAGSTSGIRALGIDQGSLNTLDLQVPLSTPVSVTGRIVDLVTGAPVGTATLRLIGTEQRQVSDRDGRFAFLDVPPGRYALEVQHLGYGMQSDSLIVGGGQEMEIEMRLPTRAIAMEGVIATVTAGETLGPIAGRGFEERRRMGFGHFLGPEELAAGLQRTLPEVLRTIPGVWVQGGSRNHYTVWMARQTPSLGDLQTAQDAPTCTVRVYVDRVLWHGGINEIDLADIRGIEVYRGASEIPGEFGGSNARCGVIVLWTRRGR